MDSFEVSLIMPLRVACCWFEINYFQNSIRCHRYTVWSKKSLITEIFRAKAKYDLELVSFHR